MASSTPTQAPGLVARVGHLCPCDSGKNFELCCQLLLSGHDRPATAEALMRSRFTAHVVNDYAYLHRTHRPTANVPYLEETGDADDSVKWTKLVVHSHEPGASPDNAFVEFSAFFTDEAGDHVIHEKSEFHRDNGQWLYTRVARTGPAPFKAVAKPGRNEPCLCGSGKKYKHCCLGKA
jgi:SEC-C motif-containing protein